MRYDRPFALFGNGGTLSFIGAWSFRSETNQFEIPSRFLDEGSYSLYDASIVWERLDGKYELGLYGRNLADKEYKVSGHQFVTPDGRTPTLGLEGVANAFYGPPRTITFTARVNF